MENREFDFDEPIIFCAHNLDIGNPKKLATELAKRLGVNINILKLGGEVMETITIPNATSTKNLNILNPKYDKFFKYALEYGDEAHVIANDYLQYFLPASVDYLKLIETLKQKESADEELDSFIELKKFGATEVYIANTEEVNLTDDDKQDWSNVFKVIGNLESHFLYKLP
ncbi:hypothetical protein [Flavobacterium limnophilum]|uniref:hypothetical protein n=1 Tax=Flavobacterium limnophilum TaxID=3003262 RepID=UPI0024822359|nr:hypothetical protein [Flavobacterium limnophilum]